MTRASANNPSLFTVIRAGVHRRAICAGYAAYAERKKQWDAQHPKATPEQRDVAMNRIARECGV